VTKRSTGLTVEYHFVCGLVASDDRAATHARVLEFLDAAVKAGSIPCFFERERANALPQNDADKATLNACREFAMRRHVGLRLASRNTPLAGFRRNFSLSSTAKLSRRSYPAKSKAS
jgi:hypothetical protein